MYHNWFRYGDVEVANNIRVQQYVENGLKPTGTFIAPCDDCGDLPTVVDDVPEYRTPELDFAPWVLGNDFDAGDFAGVMVKEVTGLEDNTTQVEVLEKVGDGGAIGTRRSTSKTIAVTADVVARTREAASLGLEWLGAALHPPCSPGGDCAGGVLHMFSACPTACVGQTDPDSVPVTQNYGNLEEFETTGRKVPAGEVVNLLRNSSFELGDGTTVTNWQSFGLFFFNLPTNIASMVPPAGPATGIPDRTRVARITLPVLTGASNGAFFGQTKTGMTVGERYTFSAWVYVPAATTATVAVGANAVFAGVGGRSEAKDRWQWLSTTFVAENTSTSVGFFIKGATPEGSVVYLDGAVFRAEGGGMRTTGFSVTGDTEGWVGTAGPDPSFSAPASITNSVAGNYLQLTWTPALGAGATKQGAYGLVHATGYGEVYTITFEVFVPSGSPDVLGSLLFHSHGEGRIITTKDEWVPVSMTTVGNSTFIRYGVTTAPGQGAPGVAGTYVRIRNPHVWPGRYVPPRAYFDGATTDIPNAALVLGAPVTLGASTFFPGTIGSDGNVWTRMTGAVNTGARATATSTPPAGRYVASWEVLNDSAVSVSLSTDWSDTMPGSSITVLPGEKRRIYAAGERVYDGTYRFTDLAFGTGGGEILFRDVQVVPDAPVDYTWTGAVDDSDALATPLGNYFVFSPDAGENSLYGPVLDGVCDDVRVTWTVSSSAGSTVGVQAGWATPGGDVPEWGPVMQVGPSPVDIVLEAQSTPAFPDDWRPVLRTLMGDSPNRDEPPVTVLGLSVSHRPVLSVEECVKPYRRTLHNVVTVEGPKVVEWLTLGDTTDGSTVARVEWTWVATDPHLWHDPVPLLTDVQGKGAGAPAYQAPGVPLTAGAVQTVASTACARPAATALTCADNTLGPGIILPPQAPVLADSSVMVLTGTSRTRRAFEIPVEASPIGLGKLSWRFVNDDKPKFGIRVRIWNDTIPGFTPEVECSFAEEFTIEYLAPDQTLYIDGPGDDAYVYCGDDVLGQPIYAPALKNLRGNYGGPFQNSVIGCGRPYYIAVDIPNNYTTNPSDLSGLGTAAQGDVLWSVDLVRRA